MLAASNVPEAARTMAMTDMIVNMILELIPHSKTVRWSVGIFFLFVLIIWLFNR
jgi:hypothetical protein